MKSMFSTIIKAFKIGFTVKGPMSVIINLLGFGMAFLPLLISLQLRTLTDQLQGLYGAGAGGTGTALSAFGVLASFYVLQTAFKFFQGYFIELDKIKVRKYLKQKIIRCACEAKYKYIENYDGFQEKMSFIDSFSGERVTDSIQSIIVWLQNLVVCISLIVLLGGVNVWIVAAIIAASIPTFISEYKFNDEEFFTRTMWMVDAHWGYHYFHVAAHPSYKQQIRFFGLGDYITSKWRNYTFDYFKIKNKLRKKYFFFNSVSDIIRNGIMIVVLLITAYQIYQNPAWGLGLFMLVFSTSTQLQDVLSQLFVKGAQFAGDINYMKSYFDLDELERDMQDDEAVPFESVEIAFDNVDFSYPNAAFKAIDGLSVKIRQGEKIAVVGENGSGKTTFVNLLCGMFDPDNGNIKINGQGLSDNLAKVRKSISVVFQDFCHYEDTLRENIIISDRERPSSDTEIEDLARHIGAEDVIAQQKDGLDEIVGLFSEKGNNLSGGQWQKVAILRAAYRKNARLMILDEPTAALDPMAEANLYTAFSRLTGDKTAILISHRLGVTSLVDRILVFDRGRIVEDGTHKELLGKNGRYAEMYRAQAQWYVGTV